MTGLARDGGLLLPEHIPDLGGSMPVLRGLSYGDLAFAVMRPYVDLPDDTLRRLIRCSYATFHDPEVTPVRAFGDTHILELFHGPTLAFKDVALQLLGNLFEYNLQQRQGTLTIVAATSGDTGSAAIYGVKGKAGIRIFVMHPKGRTSKLQERQMTTVLDGNVHNLAVHGTFDDCQSMVKTVFNDLEFRDRHHLGAVNSINWARVLAQVVYYAYAALQVTGETGADRVRFAVPTGNFGDIFAGYIAARMGFPIGKLILATNANDILTRFFATGRYRITGVVPTMSPSMDIQVASNFERYLYYRLGESGEAVTRVMNGFQATGELRMDPGADGVVDPLIAAACASEDQTLAAIRGFYLDTGYLLDPHTAVGYHAGMCYRHEGEPLVCLATAHPAKFPEAIKAALGMDVAHHPLLDALHGLPVRCDDLEPDAGLLMRYIASRAV
jgi:threonine synthase